MKVYDFDKRAYWVMPWNRGEKAIQVKSVLFNDGSEAAVSDYRESKLDDFLSGSGNMVASQSKPVTLRASFVPIIRWVQHSRSGWLDNNPESFTHIDTTNTISRICHVLEDFAWEMKALYNDMFYNKKQRRYGKLLNVNFKKTLPLEGEKRRWTNTCSRCGINAILRESDRDLDPRDKMDTNLTLWLEGKETRSHSHPLNFVEACERVRDLMTQHLEKCDGTGKLDLEGYWSADYSRKFSDRFEAWRTQQDGRLTAKCITCDEVFVSYSSDAVTEARDWQKRHYCSK